MATDRSRRRLLGGRRFLRSRGCLLAVSVRLVWSSLVLCESCSGKADHCRGSKG